MNWYTIAQIKIPKYDFYEEELFKPSTSSLLKPGLFWLDPNGKNFPVLKITHLEWLKYYENFIKREYGLTNTNYANLLQNSWVRGRFFADLFLVLNSFNNNKAIKNIENILFKLNNPKQDISIVEYDGNNTGNYAVEFVWQEFLNTGLSFLDFISTYKYRVTY